MIKKTRKTTVFFLYNQSLQPFSIKGMKRGLYRMNPGEIIGKCQGEFPMSKFELFLNEKEYTETINKLE